MKKCIYFLSFFILLSVLFSPICYSYTPYLWSENDFIINTSNNISNSIDLQLESGAAILIEQNTGKILYEHNSHEQLRPASVTKVMSILLIMEALDSGLISLSDKVPCSENASKMGGSQIWLDVRETLTIDEMLKAICIASANDCTVAMAEYLCGSQEAFVDKMNTKAKELGMNDTTFKNCHGLDTDGHVTSAYDISLMSRELLKNHPSVTKYTTIWMDTLREGKSQLTNTNKLIRNYKGATGLKTGSTALALYNLSASATRDNLSLIAVIMKAPNKDIRFSEAQKLLDYGFSHFSYTQFANEGDILKQINVSKGIKPYINAVYSNTFGIILEKGMENNIEQIINIPNVISAPIELNQKIGEINYFLNGEILGKIDIISGDSVKNIGINNMFEKLFFSWFRVLR